MAARSRSPRWRVSRTAGWTCASSGSKLAFLGQLLRVALRRQLRDPHFAYLRAQEVRVDCDPPAAVQLDGDYFGRTPVEIRNLPGAVRIIRPA